MNLLNDKTVLITGASSGIGEACATQYAENGANVILTARRTDKIDALANRLSDEYGIKALAITLDVSDRAAVKNTIEKLPEDFKNIDILVNNAGLALSTDKTQDANIDNWDTMIDTNLKGLLYVTHAVLQIMKARGTGHIVNISSIAGHEVYPAGNIYSATKHAVRALSKSMRLDLLGTPIRVTDIAPGAVETEFSKVRWGNDAQADAFYSDFTPLMANDIADAIIYATSRKPHVSVAEMVVYPTDQAHPMLINKGGKLGGIAD